MLAVKIIAAILGFISGVLIYPWLDQYVYDLVALIGAIATAVIVYSLIVGFLRDARL